MNATTKNFLKMSIIGMLGGGSLALMAANEDEEEAKKKENEGKNEIVVPLSRSNFLRSVGKQTKAPRMKAEGSKPTEAFKDISQMSAKDLADYKRQLLKGAESKCPSQKPTMTGPKYSMINLRRKDGAFSPECRDSLGRYSCEEPQEKIALNLFPESTYSTMASGIGALGGVAIGAVAMKKLLDKIRLGRETKRLEENKRRYADMIGSQDVEKSAQAVGDLAGSMLGMGGLYLGVSALASGMVAYRIMENRRKAEEKKSDKDLSKYPDDKVIKYKFV